MGIFRECLLERGGAGRRKWRLGGRGRGGVKWEEEIGEAKERKEVTGERKKKESQKDSTKRRGEKDKRCRRQTGLGGGASGRGRKIQKIDEK